jgi:dTDP-glucose pyrophosphorylase
MTVAIKDGVFGRAGTPLAQLLEAMDRRGVGALVLTDAAGALEGVVRDSTVRRALATEPGAGLPPLEQVIDRNPPTASEDASVAEIAGLMSGRSRYVVALDRFKRPSGLFTAHAIPGVGSISEAVIMAGGLGSRLRPFTHMVPKPLLMVGESPILEILIGHLARFGVRRVYLAVNYLGDKIKSYFADGRNHGVEIRYLEEREALGTAGALRLLPERPEQSFLVMNADLLTGLNLSTLVDVHEGEGAMLTVGTVPHRYEIPYGVIQSENMRITTIKEKPTNLVWINGGIYMVRPKLLDLIPPDGPTDMPTVIDRLIKSGEGVATYAMRESWLDIGQLQDYQRAVRDVVTPAAAMGSSNK